MRSGLSIWMLNIWYDCDISIVDLAGTKYYCIDYMADYDNNMKVLIRYLGLNLYDVYLVKYPGDENGEFRYEEVQVTEEDVNSWGSATDIDTMYAIQNGKQPERKTGSVARYIFIFFYLLLALLAAIVYRALKKQGVV
jgi:hypothetical protein